MKALLQRLRSVAPLLICVGLIFPWAVSPFGILSCSSEAGSFVPESRSWLRQWLPLETTLDKSVDHKEDPSVLGGFENLEVFYFDPLILAVLVSGFIFSVFLQRRGVVGSVLARCSLGLIWLYLTGVFFLVLYLTGCQHPHELWFQPGILMVLAGYLILTAFGVRGLFLWWTELNRRRRHSGKDFPAID